MYVISLFCRKRPRIKKHQPFSIAVTKFLEYVRIFLQKEN